MKKSNFLKIVYAFKDRIAPEEGFLVGYVSIIEALKLKMPLPDSISIISGKNRRYQENGWNVFTPRHKPDDTLYKQLVFALKYEGINLLLFKKLFEKIEKVEVENMLSIEPTGIYSRKIWFLYEWLMMEKLNKADLTIKNFEPLLSELQYSIVGTKSARHRIINNLPGTIDYCPLINKTPKLEKFLSLNLSNKSETYLNDIHKGVLQRAAAFLYLKDSKASFRIEGESPKASRTMRWGKAIAQAGTRELNIPELKRLQELVIESNRFIKMGFRKEGGFVGEHDRLSNEPIPDHISARWQDIKQLINGLLSTNNLLEDSDYEAVLAATVISFGFVFIHPFEDGNGRIHRYLIHDILAKMKFNKAGIIFPVSASILDHIVEYRNVLEFYSKPLLDFIEWKVTEKNNIEVINQTIDFYRYFDATKQAEFLFDCVTDTIENLIPEEVSYIERFDEMKRYLDDEFELPDKTVSLLFNVLEQNNGKLSKRAKSKEFKSLTEQEIDIIETNFAEILKNNHYITFLKSLSKKELETEIEMKIMDSQNNLIDTEDVTSVIASTNAHSWGVDDYHIEEFELFKDECYVNIHFHASGEHNDEKNYHGSSLNGTATIIIDKYEAVRIRNVTAELEYEVD